MHVGKVPSDSANRLFFFFLVGYFGTALLDALPPTLAYHHSPIFSDQVFLDI